MARSHANHLNTIARKLYGLKGYLKAQAIAAAADELIAEGQRLVNKAGEESSYQNRLGNLRSSIGSCLYINGKEYQGPSQIAREMNTQLARFEARGLDTTAVRREGYSRRFYEAAPASTKPRKFPDGETLDGDDAINKFFNEYKAPKGVWQLVVATGMYYSGAVEAKGYWVISFIRYSMSNSAVAQKYKGIVKDVPNRWNAGTE